MTAMFSDTRLRGQRAAACASLALAVAVAWSPGARAQQTATSMPPPLVEIVFVCPFDRSIRSLEAGDCERRGQRAELVAEVPEPLEFPVELTTVPRSLRPAQPGRLRFLVRDPWVGNVAHEFMVVHESPFHVFIVSADLEFFAHDHPRRVRGGFELPVTLPRAGHYRVLADFLPEAATPQLAMKSVFVAGEPMRAHAPSRDYAPKQGDNLRAALVVMPDEPVAGTPATLRFELSPETGLEPYLGAPAHLLAASDDLIDLIHAHPLATEPHPTVQFSVLFPRARTYRIWAQFQRDGVVNTVRFDVPVRSGQP